MKLYIAYVDDCNDEFIVKANNKKEAIEKIFNELNFLYSPKKLIENGYKPYYKKDIHPVLLEDEFDSNGVYNI